MFDELIMPLFSTEWGRRAGWGVIWIAGILLFFTVINSFLVWRDDYLISREPVRRVALPQTINESAKWIAQIPERHLFGQKNVAEAVPVTSMQLRLIGIMQAIPDGVSKVIISEAGAPGKIYEVGDSLPSGVKVHEITRDGVILENGGRLEKLPLSRPELLFQGMPKPLSEPEE